MLGLAVPAGVMATSTWAAPGIVVNPQAGITASRFDTGSQFLNDEARTGFQLGGFLRIGGRIYLEPGLFYQKRTLTVQGMDPSAQEFESDLDANSLWIPVFVGFNVLESGPLTLRVNGGPSGLLVLSGAEDDFFGITKDSYKDLVLHADIGIGADITMFTVDLGYQFGLGDTFAGDLLITKEEDSKQNTWRFAAGVKF